jgi:hypothetical protein
MPGQGQETNKTIREHFVILKSKEALKDCKGHVKKDSEAD